MIVTLQVRSVCIPSVWIRSSSLVLFYSQEVAIAQRHSLYDLVSMTVLLDADLHNNPMLDLAANFL